MSAPSAARPPIQFVLSATRAQYEMWCYQEGYPTRGGRVRHLTHPDQLRGYGKGAIIVSLNGWTDAHDQLRIARMIEAVERARRLYGVVVVPGRT